jgi:hypothetical protein
MILAHSGIDGDEGRKGRGIVANRDAGASTGAKARIAGNENFAIPM